MSYYWINTSLDSSGKMNKEIEVLSINKLKAKPITSVYQSRTTEDTGTFKLSNYKIWDQCKNTNYLAKIHNNLREKYTTTTEFYNSRIVHDIMYNENNQIVSIFKDFLILDDLTEFLKRYYYKEEVWTRLPKIFTFYSSAFPTYPNYAILPENKYMFKNISKKQKVL